MLLDELKFLIEENMILMNENFQFHALKIDRTLGGKRL